MRKLISMLLLLGTGAVAVIVFPDVKRYLKIRAM
jgi:hypothetical protein